MPRRLCLIGTAKPIFDNRCFIFYECNPFSRKVYHSPTQADGYDSEGGYDQFKSSSYLNHNNAALVSMMAVKQLNPIFSAVVLLTLKYMKKAIAKKISKTIITALSMSIIILLASLFVLAH